MRPALLLFFIAGCGEPALVRIVDRVDADGTFSTRDVELVTLESVTEVRGGAAALRGGATLDVLAAPPIDRGVGRAELFRDDVTPQVEWIADGDVAVATSYDGLAMLSAYAHFERAVLFFQELGIAIASDPVPVYYHPTIDDGARFGIPSTDNAAFFPNADAVFLLPMVVLDDIPFPVNGGVLAHEYAHRVFYYEAWGARMFEILSSALDASAPDPNEAATSWNLIRATDEGFADLYGALIFDDPRFISHSVFPELAEPRDMSVLRSIDPSWTSGVAPTAHNGAYDPYAVGAVLASTFWAIKDLAGAGPLAAAVVAAQRAQAAALAQRFQTSRRLDYSVGELEARVIAGLPAAVRSDACDRARLSYSAAWSSFSGVCP
jgi:hypothetical protein